MNNDGNMNCTNCGAPLRASQPQPQQPQPSPYAQQSPYAQPRQPRPVYQQPQQARPQPQPQPQPAGGNYYPPQPPATVFNFYNFWYKFMLYAGFFMTSIGLFFLGLGQLIGWQYGDSDYVDQIADHLGGLRASDIVTGIIFMLLAVGSIFVWYQYRYLRYIAPKLTLILYGSVTGIYLVYFIIEIIVLATSKKVAISATKVFPIIFPIILMIMLIATLIAQIFYFKSEKHHFVYYPQPKQAPAPMSAYPQNNQYNAYPQNNQYNYQQNNYQQNNQNNNNNYQ